MLLTSGHVWAFCLRPTRRAGSELAVCTSTPCHASAQLQRQRRRHLHEVFSESHKESHVGKLDELGRARYANASLEKAGAPGVIQGLSWCKTVLLEQEDLDQDDEIRLLDIGSCNNALDSELTTSERHQLFCPGTSALSVKDGSLWHSPLKALTHASCPWCCIIGHRTCSNKLWIQSTDCSSIRACCWWWRIVLGTPGCACRMMASLLNDGSGLPDALCGAWCSVHVSRKNAVLLPDTRNLLRRNMRAEYLIMAWSRQSTYVNTEYQAMHALKCDKDFEPSPRLPTPLRSLLKPTSAKDVPEGIVPSAIHKDVLMDWTPKSGTEITLAPTSRSMEAVIVDSDARDAKVRQRMPVFEKALQTMQRSGSPGLRGAELRAQLEGQRGLPSDPLLDNQSSAGRAISWKPTATPQTCSPSCAAFGGPISSRYVSWLPATAGRAVQEPTSISVKVVRHASWAPAAMPVSGIPQVGTILEAKAQAWAKAFAAASQHSYAAFRTISQSRTTSRRIVGYSVTIRPRPVRTSERKLQV
ncbi:Man1b1 [Symbiodinium natans]|uniref:Man1b1 protein n=1 Tax=Symbiodinium natans TaxID=878477 RepID=A0A812QY35_9DINO|nr:Man1b1 [Symbiodinium natans]